MSDKHLLADGWVEIEEGADLDEELEELEELEETANSNPLEDGFNVPAPEDY